MLTQKARFQAGECSSNAPGLYSGDSVFRPLPGHQPLFVVFPGRYRKLTGHLAYEDRFLPNTLHLIVLSLAAQSHTPCVVK